LFAKDLLAKTGGGRKRIFGMYTGGARGKSILDLVTCGYIKLKPKTKSKIELLIVKLNLIYSF